MSDRRVRTQNAVSVTLANATCGAGNPAVVHALLERLATCHGSAVIDVDQAGHALAISDFKRDAMHARRSGAGLALVVRRLQCFHQPPAMEEHDLVVADR